MTDHPSPSKSEQILWVLDQFALIRVLLETGSYATARAYLRGAIHLIDDMERQFPVAGPT